MAKKKDQEVKQQPVEAVAETQPKKKSASKNKAAKSCRARSSTVSRRW